VELFEKESKLSKIEYVEYLSEKKDLIIRKIKQETNWKYTGNA